MSMEWKFANCERQIRKLINEEAEAVNSYEDSIAMLEKDFPEAAMLLEDIADEERAHIGELQALYTKVFPDKQKSVDEGVDEAFEKIDEMVKKDVQDAMVREVIPPVERCDDCPADEILEEEETIVI